MMVPQGRMSNWDLSRFQSRLGATAWGRAQFEYQFLSSIDSFGLGSLSEVDGWYGSGISAKFQVWCVSQFESNRILTSRTQFADLKIVGIFSLNPRIFNSKQRQLGIKLRGNSLKKDQIIEKISSEFLKPNVPIFVLKEVEMIMGFWRRKMRFCLVNEEFWLVFR